MSNFQISIEKSILKSLVDTAQPEYRHNKDGEAVTKSKKLTGTWVKEFQNKVQAYEEEVFNLKGKV